MVHDAAQCPTPDAPDHAPEKRATAGSCDVGSCPACLATPGCLWCVTRNNRHEIVTFFCTASPSFCGASGYGVASGNTDQILTACPGNGTQGTPTLQEALFELIFLGIVTDKNLVATTISTSFDAFEGNNAAKHVNPFDVLVVELLLVQGTSLRGDQHLAEEDLTKRAGSNSQANTRCEFKVHAEPAYGGGQSQCNIDVQNWLNSLALGVPIGNGLTPVAKSGGSSNGNNNGLSGGDIAGIVIACIIGAALIAAILLWIVLLRRKSGSHPAPFRSPAAAFRP